jgi:stearoyl-CoA desaturase (delta-9 desaturase)
MDTTRERSNEKLSWALSVPFFLMHLAPLAIFFTGVTLRSVVLCVGLYFVRMFFITAGYHRYFAHRSYKMGRVMRFVMAFGGTTSAQKGVLWWAAHHRHHHKHSDEHSDVHSPRHGFWWSHVGWFLCDKYNETRFDLIPDLAKYPELRWLNRYHLVPPTLLALACVAIDGWTGLVIGFFLSTVLLYHGTFTINSLTHVFGRRRYVTADTSRNSFILALITLGEGWHNNHHYYQRATNQGFFWWEIDISFYLLKVLSWLRLVHSLHTPPQRVLDGNRIKNGCEDVGMLLARG